MIENQLHLLITRPEKQGLILMKKLADNKLEACCQPLFDYQTKQVPAEIKRTLTTAPKNNELHTIVIFVSVAAVEYANELLPLKHWQVKNFLTVGEATQKALLALDITANCPKIHDSEGLLSLPELSNIEIKNKAVIIVRGDGGRELIAETLKKRQAQVRYFESYQRVWRKLPGNIVQQWQAKQINAIVVTSNAALEKLTELLLINKNAYWQTNCLWLVASQRIADNAIRLGLTQVINSQGANDEAILSCLNQLNKHPIHVVNKGKK